MFGARGRITPKKRKVSPSNRTHVTVTMTNRPEVEFIAGSDRGRSCKQRPPRHSRSGSASEGRAAHTRRPEGPRVEDPSRVHHGRVAHEPLELLGLYPRILRPAGRYDAAVSVLDALLGALRVGHAL